MDRRLELQAILEGILGNGHVYFQPPPNIQLAYPCIIYKLDDYSVNFANDAPYMINRKYTVTLIDRDPDSEIRDKMLFIKYCSMTQAYTADNLNHWVYDLYY